MEFALQTPHSERDSLVYIDSNSLVLFQVQRGNQPFSHSTATAPRSNKLWVRGAQGGTLLRGLTPISFRILSTLSLSPVVGWVFREAKFVGVRVPPWRFGSSMTFLTFRHVPSQVSPPALLVAMCYVQVGNFIPSNGL